MPTSLFSRLRAADIPWTRHLLILLISWYYVELSGVRQFLTIYTIVAFLTNTEHVLAALQDPNEPPLIPHPYLPFLGHVIGMFWHGADYFPYINKKTQHPIFTLQTLNARSVGVVDPYLAAPIQRTSKNTNFYGMIMEVTKRLVDLDEASMEVVRVSGVSACSTSTT